jgi:hypothetical protein
MSDHTTKDLIEVGVAAGVVLAGAAALPAAIAPGVVGAAWMALYKRRVARWWKLVSERGTPPEELAAKVQKGLLQEDENVIAGVVEGARAATASVDIAAVPVIAELSRRFLSEEDIPRWFYRGSLEVLERLSAGELGSLARLLVEMEEIASDTITVTANLPGEKGWKAFQTSVPDAHVSISRFDDSARVFGYLKRAGLGQESNAWGHSGAAEAIVIEHRVASWLRQAFALSMSLPDAAASGQHA